MGEHNDKLRDAYAVTLGEVLLAGIGSYTVGGVAFVAPDEVSASAWIEQHQDDLGSLERGEAGLVRVGDPWRFMRRAAREGLAGGTTRHHIHRMNAPLLEKIDENCGIAQIPHPRESPKIRRMRFDSDGIFVCSSDNVDAGIAKPKAQSTGSSE